MPKRRIHSPDSLEYYRTKKQKKYDKLREKMRQLRREIQACSSSESETSDENLGNRSIVTSADIHDSPVTGNEPSPRIREQEVDVVPVATNEISLDVFGADPASENKQGDPIHEGVASRWNHIIKKGLDKENLKTLIDRYPPPANCALTPPRLNDEISDALKDSKIRVDKYLQKLQSQVAAGLTALGGNIQEEINIAGNENRPGLEKLADTAKLFADMFHSISLHRRFLINPELNPNLRKHIDNIDIDEFLYGSNLMEKVKQIQSSRSASNQVKAAVKPRLPNISVPPTSTSSRGNLNWRRPYGHPKMKEPMRDTRIKRDWRKVSEQIRSSQKKQIYRNHQKY